MGDRNALEGVPSMTRNSVFYFVSNQSLRPEQHPQFYRGTFSDGNLRIEPGPGVSNYEGQELSNFDAEISPGRQYALLLWKASLPMASRGPPPFDCQEKPARLLCVTRNSAVIMEQSIRRGLNYAAATSAAELELFFMRLEGSSRQFSGNPL